MSLLPHLLVQIQEFAARVKTALGSFFGKVAEKTESLRFQISYGFDSLMERLPSGKQRFVLIGAAGVLVVLVFIFAGTLLAGKNSPRDGGTAVSRAAPQVALQSAPRAVTAPAGILPPEELFLPDEPDFVPGVLLEREQRALWTAADVTPLWQDPLRNGEEPWRNQIEKTIDAIMESVP